MCEKCSKAGCPSGERLPTCKSRNIFPREYPSKPVDQSHLSQLNNLHIGEQGRYGYQGQEQIHYRGQRRDDYQEQEQIHYRGQRRDDSQEQQWTHYAGKEKEKGKKFQDQEQIRYPGERKGKGKERVVPQEQERIYHPGKEKGKGKATTHTSQKSAKSTHAETSRKATEADAERAGIPTDYSIKNWDPDELPLVLLGSVFDANSLGKWIYDWAKYHYEPPSDTADMAGDLWLLLIKLAGKMKLAEDRVNLIRSSDNREMIADFIDSGNRLWQRFKKLLKACEKFMLSVIKRDKSGKLVLDERGALEFIDSIFGRDRELKITEGIMDGIRLFSQRFDKNCRDILERPSAN
jgi:hypothetical protein